MNFENKTVAEIYDLIISSFETNFNTKFRLLPKSFLRILAKVVAGLFVVVCKMAGWLALQIFPDTASGKNVSILGKSVNPLALWASLVGASERAEATFCKVKVSAKALSTGILYEGTQLKNSITGKNFAVCETKSVEEGDVEFDVECTESGSAGNLQKDDELKFVAPLGFVEETAKVSSVIVTARDEETDDEWREKIVTKLQTRPQGGALSDFREWAMEVSGVKNAWVQASAEVPNGVEIFIEADEDVTGSRIATRDLCIEVGKNCTFDPETGLATRKPVTAVLDTKALEEYDLVKPCQMRKVDVKVRFWDGDIAVAQEKLKERLKEYCESRSAFIVGLSQGKMSDIAFSVAGVSAIVSEVADSLNTVIYTERETETEKWLEVKLEGDADWNKIGFLEECGDVVVEGLLKNRGLK